MKIRFSVTFFTVTFLATAVLSHGYGQSPAPGASPVTTATQKARFQDFDPDKKLAHLTRRLSLTQSQQTRLLPILQKEADTFKSLNSDANLDERVKEKRLRKVARSAREQTLALLTPAQQAELRPKAHAEEGTGTGGSASADPDASPAKK